MVSLFFNHYTNLHASPRQSASFSHISFHHLRVARGFFLQGWASTYVALHRKLASAVQLQCQAGISKFFAAKRLTPSSVSLASSHWPSAAVPYNEDALDKLMILKRGSTSSRHTRATLNLVITRDPPARPAVARSIEKNTLPCPRVPRVLNYRAADRSILGALHVRARVAAL